MVHRENLPFKRGINGSISRHHRENFPKFNGSISRQKILKRRSPKKSRQKMKIQRRSARRGPPSAGQPKRAMWPGRGPGTITTAESTRWPAESTRATRNAAAGALRRAWGPSCSSQRRLHRDRLGRPPPPRGGGWAKSLRERVKVLACVPASGPMRSQFWQKPGGGNL